MEITFPAASQTGALLSSAHRLKSNQLKVGAASFD